MVANFKVKFKHPKFYQIKVPTVEDFTIMFDVLIVVLYHAV